VCFGWPQNRIFGGASSPNERKGDTRHSDSLNLLKPKAGFILRAAERRFLFADNHIYGRMKWLFIATTYPTDTPFNLA
jgi:hypothetical protein